MKKISILLLGGTGAIGTPLQHYLLKLGYSVSVTSRKIHQSEEVDYLVGNAHEINFLNKVLENESYDAVVDFMSYDTTEFPTIIKTILPRTRHYIYISSSRVYAPSDGMLTEDSPRLLDVCNDRKYLSTDEYALRKARQENMLYESGRQNYTIIRPSITYNSNRLQYCVGEKEEWLYRAINRRKVIVPKDLDCIYTTMSFGDDVARAIALLVLNNAAYGEAVHIAGANAVTWADVMDIYSRSVKKYTGYEIEKYYIKDSLKLSLTLNRYYQIKYARAVSRRFDNSKLWTLIGKQNFVDIEEGLSICVKKFLEEGMRFLPISWRTEAYFDKLSGDKTTLKAFPSNKGKVGYLIGRYSPYFKIKCEKERRNM